MGLSSQVWAADKTDKADNSEAPPSATVRGARTFMYRCSVCHGLHGDGKSDLANILKPPPANLTISKLTIAQKRQIVTEGGAAVGRSPNMPVWKLELSPQEIEDVVQYVQTLNPNNNTDK